jgi:hypothetical protein
MANVLAKGNTLKCDRQINLRQVLLQIGIDLYNSGATVIDCWRINGCDICAVHVEGQRAPHWRSNLTRWDLLH